VEREAKLDTRSRTRELQFVDCLLGAVRSLIRHQDAGLDAATFLVERLQLLRKATLRSGPASAGALEGLASATSRASEPTRFEADSMLRKIARTGIGKIIVTRQRDGSGIIEIDGAAVFKLSRKLADLLDLLVSTVEVADDGFPAFVTYAQVRSAVGIHHGKGATSSNHPAVQLVHRLRKAFEKADLNPFFVDSDRARGVRILVRRRSGSVTGPPVA
jgi:hypothetical protein